MMKFVWSGKINLYEKAKLKVLEILLKCEKSTTALGKFLPKTFNKDITEDQKSVFLNAMKLFDIRNIIVSLFRNGFIKSLSTVKLELKTKTWRKCRRKNKIKKTKT